MSDKTSVTAGNGHTYSIRHCDHEDGCVVLERTLSTHEGPTAEFHIPADVWRWLMQRAELP